MEFYFLGFEFVFFFLKLFLSAIQQWFQADKNERCFASRL